MRRASRLSACISLLFLVISISSVTFFQAPDASAQQCEITICKSAEGAGLTSFPFTADDGVRFFDFGLVSITESGLCLSVSFSGEADLEVTEGFVPGWVLDNVICETDGINFTFIGNGVDLECVAGDFGTGTCTFFNVQSARPIPTLSEWGMIAAAGGLGLVGVFYAVRRKRLQASA